MKSLHWWVVYLVVAGFSALGILLYFQSRGGRQEDPVLPSDDRQSRAKSLTEPAFPLDAVEAQKGGYVPLKGGGYYFERDDGVEGVAVPAVTLVSRGIVELFACGSGGKEHESVLRIDCDIQSLDAALTFCGLRPGRVPGDPGKPGERVGDRVVALVQWREKGKVVTYRAEDLILHARRRTRMPRTGWVYVGRWFEVSDPTSRKGETYKILAAAGTRSLMTTWRDRSALIDNPMPDAEDDSLYYANHAVLPAPGTGVLVLLRRPTAEEAREIASVEKELKK